MERWKLYNATVWVILSSISILFTLEKFPWPRPSFIFLGIGLGTSLLFVQSHNRADDMSKGELQLFLAAALSLAIFLRWTMWSRVVFSGSDMVAHLAVRAGYIIEQGHRSLDLGMYTHSPLIHIWSSINIIILDIDPFSFRHLNVIVSGSLPLLIFILGKEIDDIQTGAYAMLLSATFPLFLRTGAMFESESLALPWFMLLIFLLFKSIGSERTIWRGLLILIAALSTYIHFLYPIIMIGTIAGVLLLSAVIWEEEFCQFKPVSLPVIGYLGAVLFVGFRMLSTEEGRQMIIGVGFQSSSMTLPSSLISFFLPSSGAVGQATATGVSSNSGPWSVVLNFLPIILFLCLASVGGLYTIWTMRKKQQSMMLFLFSVVISIVTIVALLFFSSRSTMRLGFRFYYFSGLIGIILAAISFRHAIRHDIFPRFCAPIISEQTILTISILIVFTLSTLGPMSTVGNNVDPGFGGNSVATTFSDYQQLNSLNSTINGKKRLTPNQASRVKLPRNSGPVAPLGRINHSLVDVSSNCGHNAQVWSSSSFSLCHEP